MQMMVVYIDIALETAKGGFATRPVAMKRWREAAWANFRASIKGFKRDDPRRVTRAVFVATWNQMVASVESSTPNVRGRSGTSHPTKKWTTPTNRPFWNRGYRYGWSVQVIMQREVDELAHSTSLISTIIETIDLNWIEIDGKRVRSSPDTAFRRVAYDLEDTEKRGSHFKLLAANLRAIMHSGE